jgi:uncharacterized protein YdeI (YjbR/CyaY-like superfamily)
LKQVELKTLDAGGAEGWHDWLERHHLDSPGVWLVFYRQGSGEKSISYDEAVDAALAYGWIDSMIKKLDDRRYARKFTSRRPGSVWSKSNIERARALTREGKMTRWGLEAFERRTGRVSLLERFNAGEVAVPFEFEKALMKNKRAWSNYQRMAPSYRRRYLLWISGAKRPATREKRIAEAVRLVAGNVKDLLK